MTTTARRTAYNPPSRGPDPNCGVCLGTGVDLIFESECSECWSRRDANIADTRDMLAQRYNRDSETSAYHPVPPFDFREWSYGEHAGVTWDEANELEQILMGWGERQATEDDDRRFRQYCAVLARPPI